MDTADLKYNDRQIRVFISSTFRDMQEERDYLVKYIFPQLRKLCESRDVVWGEVDLRWGVTDEQAAEGKVEIETVYCLGLCSVGPAALVDQTIHAALNAEKLRALIGAIA